ncbi:MAG: dihydropteroate synthase [Candidatus Protistobacter heckmanni]|nr:dihydropteroate synthase [Candidatus Protistobacter heckmanni]
MNQFFQCGRFRLDLSRPQVMGILNVTPDSFSDGGRHLAPAQALEHAQRMIEEGADIIDIGGESARPGAPAVPEREELGRVLPIVEALRGCGRPLSVDTYKPGVMRAVLAAGADLINDIRGFREPGALEAVAGAGGGNSGLCLMHMQGEPRTMQQAPVYGDVVKEVGGFLRERAQALLAAGVAAERISVDPGFGFGKTLEHNLTLLAHLDEVAAAAGFPVLAGLSRKSSLGAIIGGKPAHERQAASVAAAMLAAQKGAAILRVHDVAATVDALKVMRAVAGARR